MTKQQTKNLWIAAQIIGVTVCKLGVVSVLAAAAGMLLRSAF
jgi:hypothetical protein